MDFSYSNVSLWSGMLQFGVLCTMMLLANVLRRKVPFFRKSLIPTAVLAGFIALILRYCEILPINQSFMEMITYHSIGLGFIALSLKIPQIFAGDKDRRAEENAEAGTQYKIICRRCYKFVINLTQEQHAGTDGTG